MRKFKGIIVDENEIKILNDELKILTYIVDKNQNTIYEEVGNTWAIYEYDINRNLIYGLYSSGYWDKHEYDENNNEIYHINSLGCWEKYEYDENDRLIHYTDSDGKDETFTYKSNEAD